MRIFDRPKLLWGMLLQNKQTPLARIILGIIQGTLTKITVFDYPFWPHRDYRFSDVNFKKQSSAALETRCQIEQQTLREYEWKMMKRKYRWISQLRISVKCYIDNQYDDVTA